MNPQNIAMIERAKEVLQEWAETPSIGNMSYKRHGPLIRPTLAILYKDYLPEYMWSEFVEYFWEEPLLARDLLELRRRQAWVRRRHLLACW